MHGFFQTLRFIIDNFILFYSITIITSYVILAIISAFVLIKYLKKNSFIDYNVILSSPYAPSISIVAPAFNESATIVDNIRALLLLYYPNFEVIIVNDGSKDDSLEKTIAAYDLELVDFFVNYQLETKKVRGVYKSRNQSFKNLIVVDKENGGKADSLNAGINIASKDYFVSMDVDTIIEQDALLKLVKPFLEETDKKVIAAGGVIRIANSCIIDKGQITEIRLPEQLLPRFQVLEYIRAFLMARMAWSKLNGLLIISGALGMFDKDIAIKAGGYYDQTVGEDMELVVRMRRYMVRQKQKYSVSYVPDPLCWTEAPTSLKILERQRNRWTRGTIDTLLIHRKIFFNPKYGLMGMVSYPFWFFFEWMAPVIEFFGIIYFTFLAIFGVINWTFFFLLIIFIYLYAISISTYAILFEQLTFQRYKKKRDILRLLLTALIEPFTFQVLNVVAAIRGNYFYFILNKKTWGVMKRRGFSKKVE
ncbi:MAG: glycosyltransferase family 2 protein [Bacteroidales bacterium]|nr:glycosyltransferase family 2 protein [Bacteroidales bacterium]